MTYIIFVLMLGLLIAVVGFFSSSETAYISLTKVKVREMIRTKTKYAHIVSKLHGNIESLLTLVLVGTNFVNSLTTALATTLVIALVGDSGIGIATLAITFLSTTFGQIIPKTYAVTKPAETASRAAVALLVLHKLLFPLIWLFTVISKGVAALADKIWREEDTAITAEELQALFAVGEHEGTLDKNETRMLNKVFEFNDLRVHDIMRHRSFVRGVPQTADYNTIVAAFVSYGYSRLVVYEPATENIVGIIDYKTVLFEKPVSASDVMRAPLFVPETFTPFELLEKLQGANEIFAVVLDEQGETAGIATVDDVMRVVFDRMTDDNLAAAIPPVERVKIINGNEYVLPGDMKIGDVNDLFGFYLESEDFNTIGGWLLEQFGSLPQSGEVCKYGKTLFIVEEQSQRRIKSIRVRRF